MPPANLDVNKIADIWSALLRGNVFYLPILGPVYAGNHPIKKVLRDILENSKTDEFLPYDKNRRWFADTQERIILPAIHLENNCLMIPVKDKLNNKLKIFCYGNIASLQMLKQWIGRLIQTDATFAMLSKISLYFFGAFGNKAGRDQNIVYLKIMSAADELNHSLSAITALDKLSPRVRSTLGLLGKEPELEGFSFLAKNIDEGTEHPSSVICAVTEDKIIGAIGPVDVAYDGWGDKWLLPSYFGVSKKFRSLGYGEKLWETAMDIARRKGALYTLVQNKFGSPAAKFYEKTGLIKAMTYSIVSDAFPLLP